MKYEIKNMSEADEAVQSQINIDLTICASCYHVGFLRGYRVCDFCGRHFEMVRFGCPVCRNEMGGLVFYCEKCKKDELVGFSDFRETGSVYDFSDNPFDINGYGQEKIINNLKNFLSGRGLIFEAA